MTKRGAFFVLLSFFLALLAPAVHADFSIDITPVQTDVSPIDEGIFKVSLQNKASVADTFILSVSDVSWTVLSEPLSDYFSGMIVGAYGSKDTLLKISSSGGLPYGTHRIPFNVKSSKTGILKTELLTLNLLPPTPVIRDYLAAVSKIVDMPSKIDPREKFDVKINMINRNPRNLSDIIIKIRTKNGLFSKEVRTSLEPLERKLVNVEFGLEDITAPQEDLLLVSLIFEGRVLQPEIEEIFEIIGYSEVIEQESSTKKSFLKTVAETTYFNNGNIKAMKTIETKRSFLKNLFTKTWPESFIIKKDGEQFSAWQLSIEPNSSVTVRTQENYRGLLVFSVLAVLAIAAYFRFRSPVMIKKEAAVIGLREGGISELRVLLHVKNRSRKSFEKVTIIERVPKIADLEKSFDAGTLHPTKIFQHGNQGTVIKWEMDFIDKYEERMLSYKIKSKLSILGAFNLPQVIMRFHDSKGKKFITKSNRARINI